MGGMVAQGLMLDYPHRVRSAVIADSRHTTTPEFTKAWHQRAAIVRKDGRRCKRRIDGGALVEQRTGRAQSGRHNAAWKR
jgi:pimeloyl-ACP methyl ester carboxylesterase